VEANLLAVNKLNNDNFNVGTGIETSVNQLIEIISGLLNKEIKAKYAEERKGEVQRIALDVSKIENFGFKPRYDLREGMRNVLEWMNANG